MTDRLGVGTFVLNEEEQTTSQLAIFHIPNVDAVLKEGKTVYYYPTNSVDNSGPFEFIIPKDPESFTNLPYTRLEGCIEVTKDDGSALVATDNVSVVNLFTQSIFKQVECEINGVQVCDLSTPTYAWKSFLETHLSYGKGAKDTHLKCSLYEKDTATKEEAVDGSNLGSAARAKRITGKKLFFSNIIHSDFFQAQKLLIPNTEIKLKFIRNEDSFSILAPAAAKYKINIKNLKLAVRKIKIDPAVQGQLEHTLQTVPASYDLTQSKIKTYLIQKGSKTYDWAGFIQGNLPRSIIFGIVSHEAFNGNVNANPFYFNNHKVNLFNLKINGSPVLPTPYTPDFETGDFIREYRAFFDNNGMAHENESNDITLEDFEHNSCFWSYDLTPEQCNSFHLHETRVGSMDLSIGFKTETTKNLHIIAYCSFNAAIAIDSERNVRVRE